jgi:hypothetical protein
MYVVEPLITAGLNMHVILNFCMLLIANKHLPTSRILLFLYVNVIVLFGTYCFSTNTEQLPSIAIRLRFQFLLSFILMTNHMESLTTP